MIIFNWRYLPHFSNMMSGHGEFETNFEDTALRALDPLDENLSVRDAVCDAVDDIFDEEAAKITGMI